ncbi:oligopeptidase A [Methylohalomonas lacus]|uniref:oligopeptidase A n=1 Tax=Methylohalomonas lacus TaxID=398773 RepID=A0AAE3HHM6_9GAMM|nr:oligopeptidase A [Methylohalomonas lacus]MCS3902060.1 oligopeptidase A [Methylohalomonas lacus]
MNDSDNPLLQTGDLPAFDRIRPEHVEPAIDQQLAYNRERIEELLNATADYSWDNTLQPLEELDDQLNRVWSPVSHLHGVADNEALRSAYNACLEKLSDYATEMGQHRGLYQAYKQVADSAEYARLDTAQQKIVDNALRDFRLSGIDLEGDDRARYRTIQQQLSKLQTKFEENLLDATNAWHKHVTDPQALAGLPDSALDLLADNARRDNRDGWLIGLDFPSFVPVVSYCDNRELRREVYAAFVTRASDQGPHAGRWDNSEVMEQILALRHELAQLLGFASYAHYSLARKMAKTPETVLDFLGDLAERARPAAQQEYQALAAFAAETDGLDRLEAWDVAYYTEKLRQAKYELSQEDLRPYFPAHAVIEGLFTVVHKLYGIRIRERDGVAVWHDDVRYYDIYDADDTLRAGFYLDLYARPEKRGGAWMDECRVRRRSASAVQLPVAYLTCNFSPAVGDRPALLTHQEVETLFHEFGHGLHHMLTRIDHPAVAGINGVPWDVVELPSQFMENWCWERAALDLFARHYRTGAAIPDDLFARMQAAKNFQSSMQMVRQLEFSLFDFRLHLDYANHDSAAIQQLLDQVRDEVAVIKPPAFNRFQHGFAHIFAGGYAAGYYSYKWAEVLSADAFSLFEERGLFDQAAGQAFLHSILEQGGARDPLDLFVEFRGREPSIEPLLRHSGIAA